MDARPAFIFGLVEQCATVFFLMFPVPLPSVFSTHKSLLPSFSIGEAMVLNRSTTYIHATALDPTKLNKPRQFSRSTAPAKVVDNTLWTETPAERQQRLADEVMGRKRRVENADPEQGDADAKDDATKRRKRDAELQRQVDEHTVRLALDPVRRLDRVYLCFFLFSFC